MINLIKKELTANIKYILMGFGFFILYAFIFAKNGNNLFILCLIILFYSIAATNLMIDERYKIDLLLSSLPIRRRDVITSKYIMVGLVFAAGLVLYTLMFFVQRAVGYEKISALSFFYAMLGLFAISLFNGLMLPICYKFGSQATRYVSLIIFFLFFFLSMILGNTDVTQIMDFIVRLNEVQAGLILFTGALLISIVSYAITRPIYEKKDF